MIEWLALRGTTLPLAAAAARNNAAPFRSELRNRQYLIPRLVFDTSTLI
jgi:hypothetical protein